MSDEATPNRDFLEQLRDFADEAIPQVIDRWREVVKSGGKKTIRHRCGACGDVASIPVEIADNEELRKIVDSLRLASVEYAKQRSGDTTGKRASQILRDISEMTNEELAEATAALEAELAAEPGRA